MKQFLPLRWVTDIRASLTAADGWRFVGKGLVVASGFLGVILTWNSFQANLRSAELNRAEDAYVRLLGDLNSDIVRVRAAALARIPDLLTRKLPSRSRVNLAEALWLALTGKEDRQPLLAARLRREFYGFLHSGLSVQPRECQEVTGGLRSLGRAGWYSGQQPLDNTPAASSLAWMWQAPPADTDHEAWNLATGLFEDARLVGLRAEGLDLSAGRFNRTELTGVSFAKSVLNDAEFRSATIVNADFHNAQMRRVQMDESIVRDSRLDGCVLQSARLTGMRFVSSYISGVDFSPLPSTGGTAQRSDLSRVTFVDCIISDIDAPEANLFGARFVATSPQFSLGASNANFQSADLRSTVLDNVNLAESDFSNARLEAASARRARFAFAKMRGTVLDKADLTGADLSDVVGLSVDQLRQGDGIKSCVNTNIALAKGLSRLQVERLKQMGAVEFEDERRWVEYKQRGFQ